MGSSVLIKESWYQSNSRFAAGTPEIMLVTWLGDNNFSVDHRGKRAERRVKGLPYSEWVQVTWAANAGYLKVAEATVTEAGCL